MTRSGSISEIFGGLVDRELESKEIMSDSLFVGEERIAVPPFLIDGIPCESIEPGLDEILRRGLLKCDAAFPKVYTYHTIRGVWHFRKSSRPYLKLRDGIGRQINVQLIQDLSSHDASLTVCY